MALITVPLVFTYNGTAASPANAFNRTVPATPEALRLPYTHKTNNTANGGYDLTRYAFSTTSSASPAVTVEIDPYPGSGGTTTGRVIYDNAETDLSGVVYARTSVTGQDSRFSAGFACPKPQGVRWELTPFSVKFYLAANSSGNSGIGRAGLTAHLSVGGTIFSATQPRKGYGFNFQDQNQEFEIEVPLSQCPNLLKTGQSRSIQVKFVDEFGQSCGWQPLYFRPYFQGAATVGRYFLEYTFSTLFCLDEDFDFSRLSFGLIPRASCYRKPAPDDLTYRIYNDDFARYQNSSVGLSVAGNDTSGLDGSTYLATWPTGAAITDRRSHWSAIHLPTNQTQYAFASFSPYNAAIMSVQQAATQNTILSYGEPQIWARQIAGVPTGQVGLLARSRSQVWEVLLSDNGGRAFTSLAAVFSNPNISFTSFCPLNDGGGAAVAVVKGATTATLIFKRTSNLAEWPSDDEAIPVRSVNNEPYQLTLATNGTGYLYLSCASHGVLVSKNWGRVWANV